MAPGILSDPMILVNAGIVPDKSLNCNDEFRFDQNAKSNGMEFPSMPKFKSTHVREPFKFSNLENNSVEIYFKCYIFSSNK